MAKRIVTGTVFTINAVDYSAQVDEASIEVDREEVDVTVMTSQGWKEFLAGLGSFNVTVSFKKDADLSGLDAAIWTLLQAGNAVPFTIKGVIGAISTSNPEYQGNLILTKWTPISGRVGEAFGANYTWRGTGLITRDVTP